VSATVGVYWTIPPVGFVETTVPVNVSGVEDVRDRITKPRVAPVRSGIVESV